MDRMRNLLLGNGINMYLGIDEMQNNKIASRFCDKLIASSPLYKLLFGIDFSDNGCDRLINNRVQNNIESLAGDVFSYVRDKCKEDSINTDMRLIDAIICTALSAIMFDANKRIGSTYESARLFDRNLFNKVFTLNYNEFWDSDNKCIYLHGKYDNGTVCETGKNVLLYSEIGYSNVKGYSEVVEKLKSKNNMVMINTRDIVFSPVFLKKKEVINWGCYPSERLFPASDFFPREEWRLYEELKEINEITVFGVSPYGDDSLIEVLNRMKRVTVYVYNKEGSEETKEWKQRLDCQLEIMDAEEFSLYCT